MREALAKAHPRGTYAVFYDPASSYEELPDGPNYERLADQLNEKKLRAQVKDFIAWLKAQKVI